MGKGKGMGKRKGKTMGKGKEEFKVQFSMQDTKRSFMSAHRIINTIMGNDK